MKRSVLTPRRSAFSLIELLMTISILGALAALMLPAVQSAREASRRTICMNHTKQVALATLNYTGNRGETLPAMWQSSATAPWDNFSWRAALLPYLERQGLYDALELQQSPVATANKSGVSTHVELFQCPSTPGSPRIVQELGIDDARMNQDLSAAAHDVVAVFEVLAPLEGFPYQGVWYGGPNVRLPQDPYIGEVQLHESTALKRSKAARLRYIMDGLSKTALIVEQAGKPMGRGPHRHAASHPPTEGAWATCDYGAFYGNGVNNHNFRDPFGFHGGAMMALCDGSVTFLPESTPREIIVAIFSRSGSEIIEPSDWQ